ncbi:MAG: hypothetical protein QNJ64_20845 [Crocosphaera sp.]|nr:hypothetical protein [Crocosphaera sp.]
MWNAPTLSCWILNPAGKRRFSLDKIIAKTPSRTRNLVLGMIIARIINPKSKLATARGFDEKTFSNSLGKVLNLERAVVVSPL